MSFSRQALASLGLTGLYALFAMAITITATRHLGIEAFGLYASALLHINLLAILVAGGLPMLLVREITAADHAGDHARLRGAILRGRQWVLGASGLIALVALGVWSGFGGSPWWWVFLPALGIMAGLGLLEAQGAALRALGQPLRGQ